MSTREVIEDLLSRIPGPYAICLSYHPELSIRGTLHKYGNKGMVTDYAKSMRAAYTMAGYLDEAAAVKVIDATVDEIVDAMDLTGHVANLYERRSHDQNGSTGSRTERTLLAGGNDQG